MGISVYFYNMFVRQKRNPSGSISVQIVQKVGRFNRVLKTLGYSTDPHEIDQLQKQAENEKERFYGPTLFDPRPVNDLNPHCRPRNISGRYHGI